MTEPPSSLLERAAQRLEGVANEVPLAPWRVQPDGDVHSADRNVVVWSEYGDVEVQWAPFVREWVEMTDPWIAQPLANILRGVAFTLRAHPEYAGMHADYIALAEAILGDVSKEERSDHE